MTEDRAVPYASIIRKREYDRIWQRENAVRQSALFPVDRDRVNDADDAPELPDDPVAAFVDWSESTLRIPTGPKTSQPFLIPGWQRDFLNGAFADGIFEAGLSVARKNGKSGLIAAWLLANLDGPLVRPGWRCAVVSEKGEFAKELKGAMEQTANMSGLSGVAFYASPPPGRALGMFGTTVNFLAADRTTGHAIGVDLVIIDEAGLLTESDRPLWNAMLSSTSSRAGRLVAISIRSDGPMFGEIADRKNDPDVYWQEHVPPSDCAYDDKDAWLLANPGLADGIKQWSYMESQYRRTISSPANGAHFAAYDLNLPQEPERELILPLWEYKEAIVQEAPARDGTAFLGVDLGGSASMTAAVAYWPLCGRVEVYGAFPDTPDLKVRGENDGVGGLYLAMKREDNLFVYPGRVTPVKMFLEAIQERLEGERIMAVGCDRYRREEFRQAMAESGLIWPIVFRGQGAGAIADGSADVRAFQFEIREKHAKPLRSKILESAISLSAISYDKSNNPSLDKVKSNHRIDALQAAVIAFGLGRRYRRSRPKKGVYHGKV